MWNCRAKFVLKSIMYVISIYIYMTIKRDGILPLKLQRRQRNGTEQTTRSHPQSLEVREATSSNGEGTKGSSCCGL